VYSYTDGNYNMDNVYHVASGRRKQSKLLFHVRLNLLLRIPFCLLCLGESFSIVLVLHVDPDSLTKESWINERVILVFDVQCGGLRIHRSTAGFLSLSFARIVLTAPTIATPQAARRPPRLSPALKALLIGLMVW
jgi:hypothetical protein